MARVFCRGLGEIKAFSQMGFWSLAARKLVYLGGAHCVHAPLMYMDSFFIIKTYDVRSGET